MENGRGNPFASGHDASTPSGKGYHFTMDDEYMSERETPVRMGNASNMGFPNRTGGQPVRVESSRSGHHPKPESRPQTSAATNHLTNRGDPHQHQSISDPDWLGTQAARASALESERMGTGINASRYANPPVIGDQMGYKTGYENGDNEAFHTGYLRGRKEKLREQTASKSVNQLPVESLTLQESRSGPGNQSASKKQSASKTQSNWRNRSPRDPQQLMTTQPSLTNRPERENHNPFGGQGGRIDSWRHEFGAAGQNENWRDGGNRNNRGLGNRQGRGMLDRGSINGNSGNHGNGFNDNHGGRQGRGRGDNHQNNATW